MPSLLFFSGEEFFCPTVPLPPAETGVSVLVCVPVWNGDPRGCFFFAAISGRLYSLRPPHADCPLPTPILIPTPGPVRSLAAGSSWLLLGVQEPGTKSSQVRVMALGTNDEGACGVRLAPFLPTPTFSVATPRLVTRVYGGERHSAATTAAGGVVVWGGLGGRAGALPRAALYPASCWSQVDGDGAVGVGLCTRFFAVLTACGGVYSAQLPSSSDLDGAASGSPSSTLPLVSPVRVPGRAVQVVGCGLAALALTDSGHAFAWGAVPLRWLLPHQRAMLGPAAASRGMLAPGRVDPGRAEEDGSGLDGETVVRRKGGSRAAAAAAAASAPAGAASELIDVGPSNPVAVGQHALWRQFFACSSNAAGMSVGGSFDDEVLGLTLTSRVLPLAPRERLSTERILDPVCQLGRFWASQLAHTSDTVLMLGDEDALLGHPCEAIPSAAGTASSHVGRGVSVFERAAALSAVAGAVSDSGVTRAVKDLLHRRIAARLVLQMRSICTDLSVAGVGANDSRAVLFAICPPPPITATTEGTFAPVCTDEALSVSGGADFGGGSGAQRSDDFLTAPLSLVVDDSCESAALPVALFVPARSLSSTYAAAASDGPAAVARWATVLLQACHLHALSALHAGSLDGETPDDLAVRVILPLLPGGAVLPLSALGSDTPPNTVSEAPLNWFERRASTAALCLHVFGEGWRGDLERALIKRAGDAYASASGRGTATQQKRARARVQSQVEARRLGLALAWARRSAMSRAAIALAPDAHLCLHEATVPDACPSSCGTPPRGSSSVLCHSAVLRARIPALHRMRGVCADERRWCVPVPPALARPVGTERLVEALRRHCYVGTTVANGETSGPSLVAPLAPWSLKTHDSIAGALAMLAVASSLALDDLAAHCEQRLIEHATDAPGSVVAAAVDVCASYAPCDAGRFLRWSRARFSAPQPSPADPTVLISAGLSAPPQLPSVGRFSVATAATGATVSRRSEGLTATASPSAPWSREHPAGGRQIPAVIQTPIAGRPSLASVMELQSAESRAAASASLASGDAAVSAAHSSAIAIVDPQAASTDGYIHGAPSLDDDPTDPGPT